MKPLPKILYRFIDTLLAFFALWLVLYAVLEYLLTSRNGAMLLSLFMALCLSAFYYFVRSIFIARAEGKRTKEEECKRFSAALANLSPQAYYTTVSALLKSKYGSFEGKGALRKGEDFVFYFPLSSPDYPVLDRCANRLNAFAKAESLPAVLVAPFGLSKAAALLAEQAEVTVVGAKELSAWNTETNALVTSQTPLPKEKGAFKRFLQNKQTKKRCLQYALLLAVLSVFSPYSLYYRLVALMLIGLAVWSIIAARVHSKRAV